MKSFFAKSFGGLSPSYYVRHLLFGAVFMALILWMTSHTPGGISAKPGLVVFSIINTLLYPYARFVYESVIDYVVGRNMFFVNAIMMLVVKAFTMALCWGFSIFVAPVGLAYLFWRNTRASSN